VQLRLVARFPFRIALELWVRCLLRSRPPSEVKEGTKTDEADSGYRTDHRTHDPGIACFPWEEVRVLILGDSSWVPTYLKSVPAWTCVMAGERTPSNQTGYQWFPRS
jgi:hypothetical protein